MTVTFAAGAEAQQAATDNVVLGGTTQSYSTAQARTGAASFRCNPASAATGYIQFTLSSSGQWLHFGLRIATMPSVQRVIGSIPGTTVPNLRLNSDGTLAYYNDTSLIATTTQALATNTWYWVAFRQASSASPVDVIQVNGLGTTGTPGTLSSGTTGRVGFSQTEASAADIFIDDIVVDNAGFLAPSKVDFALPISDNTVTGVTDNNGVTTNIWQCVSNIPPAGVASANEAANAKKGMHFPATTVCSYIANLETYTTLGVAVADTVLAVLPIIRHGEDIATGTKNGTLVGITNPTLVASQPFVFGLDAGAHGAEVGLWNAAPLIATITSPTVALGTSPTIQVDRISESRLACMDFMGLLVVWTPAVVPALPYTSSYPQLLAQ